MTYVPFAPEYGAPITLTGPDGTVAAFNDPANPDFCGYLTDLTGLDSADVREVGDVLASADGGWHGNFWYGRRPIVLSGAVVPITSAADRATKIDKIRRASNAMRGDAVLAWTNTAAGAVPMQTWVRRQQPLRVTGGWAKNFNLSLVSQYAPLFSQANHVVSGTTTLTAENQGDYPSYPVIRLTGPSTNPVITNTTTGAALKFTSGLLAPPANLAYTVVSGSSSIGVSNWYYIVTALSAAGQTTASNEVWLSISALQASTVRIQLNWSPVIGATSYKVYRSISSPGSYAGGGEYTSPALIGTVSAPTTTFTDTGAAAAAGAVPTTNTASYSFTLASGHFADFDMLAHTGIQDGTTSINSLIDFLGTSWPSLVKGSNVFTLSGGGTFQITYRDCWA